MTLPTNSPRFPPEILHQILVYVIGNSVHTICIFPGSVDWELDVFKTLQDVSPSFNSLTTEIICKSFVISQQEPENLANLVTQIFHNLRVLATNLHNPLEGDDNLYPPPNTYSRVPLVFGYMLLTATMNMRYNVVRSSPETYERASVTILNALRKAMEFCGRIDPEGISEVLYDALRNEQELAQNGLEIVKAFSKLKTQLASFRGNLDRVPKTVQTFIHKELQVVENTHLHYTRFMPTHQLTPGGGQHQISELPGVVPVLRDLYALRIEMDEYHIHERLRYLIKGWLTSCPFLNSQQSHNYSPILRQSACELALEVEIK